jgi:hypothetical protein
MKRRDPSAARRRCACAIAGLIALAGLVDSHTAHATVGTPLEGAFSITPARRYIVARPPVQVATTRVANTTTGTLQVRVFPVLLGQLPSGAFTFDPSAPELLAAAQVLGAGPTSFSLPPGASRNVGLLWRQLPPNARIADMGVVYQATPAQSHSQVRIIERLLGVDLLKLPGHYSLTGMLTSLHVTQIKPRVLRFLLSVRNTGQAPVGPSRLVLTVRNQHGALLLSRALLGDVVLPGTTRNFVVDTTRPLPAGRYAMRGHLAIGSSHHLASMSSFELVGPNKLPTPQLEMGPLLAQGTTGEGAQVSAALKNTGTAAGATTIDLSLYRLFNGIPRRAAAARRLLAIDPLAPGRSRRLKADLGRLQQGTYRLVASYNNPDGTTETLVADFQAQQPLGLLARLRSFSTEHALLIPLLLLLLNAGTITLLLRERHSKSPPR